MFYLPRFHVLFLLATGTVALSLILGTSASQCKNLDQAFSNPAAINEMDQDWLKQPLQYQQWAEDADLAVTLDQHLFPALTPIIQQFAADKSFNIRTQEGTCGISAGLLSKKHVDIGGFCCPPGELDRLPGLEYHTLGISALGILVNQANPLTDLEIEPLKKIFRGETSKWADLIHPQDKENFNLPVQVIGRLHCKQRPGHWRLILKNEDLFSHRMYEVGTINDMITTISRNKGAIGYEVLWNIDRYNGTGKIKPLHIDGANPFSHKDLSSNKYPFYRVYNITTWKTESDVSSEIAGELVEYILSRIGSLESEYEIIPVDKLRKAGWKFNNNELIGAPN